jgi:hypothetical protein
MTFHDPVAARDLEEAAHSIRDAASFLRKVLQTDAEASNAHGLGDARRSQLLALTAEPYPNARPPAPTAPKAPFTMDEILAERKQFDNRPSRLATYLTAGAAAAIILLLMVFRTKTSPTSTAGTNTGPGSGNGAATAGNANDNSQAIHFKILPTDPAREQKARENQRATAGAPSSSLMLPEVTIPQGPALPQPDLKQMSTDIPAPQSLPKSVAKSPAPSSNPTAPAATKPDSKPGVKGKPEPEPVYALPKRNSK